MHGALSVTLSGEATIASGANGSSALTVLGLDHEITDTLATLRYQADTNFNGTDTLSITARRLDGVGGEKSFSSDIFVSPVNDAPEAPPTAIVTTMEDRPSTAVAIGASDVDGDQLFYSLKLGAGPSKGTVSFSDGTFTYTPADNANGADAFTILVSDGNGPPVEQAVSVAIAAADDAATALSLTQRVRNIAEGRPAQHIKIADISIADIDGGAHALALAGPDAANFEIVGSAVFLKARTALDFETKTSYAFAVAVDEGSAPGSDPTSQLLTIHIANASGRYVGTAAANRLAGSAEEDVILGLGGNDVLAGGTGNDAIAGGAGRDVMAGGAGADTFLFKSVKDSTGPTGVLVNNSEFHGNNRPDHRDLITDFAHGTDTINLSAIDANSKLAGNQAFTFAGGEALAKRIAPDGPDFSGSCDLRHQLLKFKIGDGPKVEFLQTTSLRDLIATHPVLEPFSDVANKENGVDIEGLAAFDDNLFVGFRGPVLRQNYVPVLRLSQNLTRDSVEDGKLVYVNLHSTMTGRSSCRCWCCSRPRRVHVRPRRDLRQGRSRPKGPDGAPKRIRTSDLCLRRATLYPAELWVLRRVRGPTR